MAPQQDKARSSDGHKSVIQRVRHNPINQEVVRILQLLRIVTVEPDNYCNAIPEWAIRTGSNSSYLHFF